MSTRSRPSTSSNSITPASEPRPQFIAAGEPDHDSPAPALAQVQRGRVALTQVAERLQGPMHALDTARRAVRFARNSLQWLALALPVAMTASYLRRGQRPPLPLILALALPILLSGRRGRQQRDPPAQRPPSSF